MKLPAWGPTVGIWNGSREKSLDQKEHTSRVATQKVFILEVTMLATRNMGSATMSW